MAPIKVLIVDDSALMRELLETLLSRDPAIKVVGTATDPLQARKLIKSLLPDVITLDIEMPKMDGLTFLEKIMTLRPMPVIMIASLTQRDAEATMKALELGAVDFFPKPTNDMHKSIEQRANELILKVKTAALANIKPLEQHPLIKHPSYPATNFTSSATEKVITIGASTGGVEALTSIISGLPPNSPAVLVAQHMPEKFTNTFAERLNSISSVLVSEARHGERIRPGHVYIAKGGSHLEVKRHDGSYICYISDAPPISGHRPSIDALFRSASETLRENAIGVILTGMGRDGTAGLLALRNAGARTLGQDQSSCVVYGMPRAAFEAGAVEVQVPLNKMADSILNLCGGIKNRYVNAS